MLTTFHSSATLARGDFGDDLGRYRPAFEGTADGLTLVLGAWLTALIVANDVSPTLFNTIRCEHAPAAAGARTWLRNVHGAAMKGVVAGDAKGQAVGYVVAVLGMVSPCFDVVSIELLRASRVVPAVLTGVIVSVEDGGLPNVVAWIVETADLGDTTLPPRVPWSARGIADLALGFFGHLLAGLGARVGSTRCWCFGHTLVCFADVGTMLGGSNVSLECSRNRCSMLRRQVARGPTLPCCRYLGTGFGSDNVSFLGSHDDLSSYFIIPGRIESNTEAAEVEVMARELVLQREVLDVLHQINRQQLEILEALHGQRSAAESGTWPPPGLRLDARGGASDAVREAAV